MKVRNIDLTKKGSRLSMEVSTMPKKLLLIALLLLHLGCAAGTWSKVDRPPTNPIHGPLLSPGLKN
jgi:hypothetical protein